MTNGNSNDDHLLSIAYGPGIVLRALSVLYIITSSLEPHHKVATVSMPTLEMSDMRPREMK